MDRAFREEVTEPLLGKKRMTPQTRKRMEHLEQLSRRWAILVASGAVDSAIQLTNSSVTMIFAPPNTGDIALRGAGISAERVLKLERVGLRTANDVFDTPFEELVVALAENGQNLTYWRQQVGAMLQQLAIVVAR